MRARIVTLNVGGTKDAWFESRRDVLVRGLKSHSPDVACLQETSVIRGSSLYDQAQDIGREIGLPVTAFAPYGNPIEVMSPEQGGIAIISRWPMVRVRNRRLPAAHETPPDARVALFVTFQTPSGELKVVNTHLSWEPDGTSMRLMQAGLILEELAPGKSVNPDSPVVLAGDFNGVETEPVIHLTRDCLLDTFRKRHPSISGYTWMTSNPLTGKYPIANRRLDYIFCPTGVHIHAAEVILHRPQPTYASDHFGVLADLEWRKIA